ncbi:MAG: hypothetical protein GOV15_02160 [Candidatus Diapherotrites archaeon]|nr:hypothetical protein [Candidatus Diapherotrites archaeon]
MSDSEIEAQEEQIERIVSFIEEDIKARKKDFTLLNAAYRASRSLGTFDWEGKKDNLSEEEALDKKDHKRYRRGVLFQYFGDYDNEKTVYPGGLLGARLSRLFGVFNDNKQERASEITDFIEDKFSTSKSRKKRYFSEAITEAVNEMGFNQHDHQDIRTYFNHELRWADDRIDTLRPGRKEFPLRVKKLASKFRE